MEIVVGFLIGIAIGATGVGGGTLTAPILILLMGYTPKTAVASALIFAAAVKLWASAVYILDRKVDFRVLAYLLITGVPGAVVGALFLDRLRIVSANEWILCGVGAVVMVSAIISVLNSRKSNRISEPRLRTLSALALPIGLESGFSSSGTGALGTLLLFHFTSMTPARVVGTDLVFGLVVCTISGGVHAMSGNCDWIALTKLIPAGIVGSLIGARACIALPTKTLRTSVLICAAGVGFSLLAKGIEGIL